MLERSKGLMHLVVLGAGATCAAFPYGDREGNRPVPAMNNFMEKTGLIEKFPNNIEEIKQHNNLEELYSLWHEDSSKKQLCEKLENEIYSYFSKLNALEYLNLYDVLLLSLTNRDVIATFNWDPFLSQSYKKISSRFTHDLPRIIFLHGNVSMGYCPDCKIIGYREDVCEKCKKPLVKLNLLYPTKEKNYTDNIYIKSAWEEFSMCIQHASLITFFGYSAPPSDEGAMERMTKAFKRDRLSSLKQIQIINIDDETLLRERYSSFTDKYNHVNVVKSFYDSFMALYPHRSADYIFSSTMLLNPGYSIDERDKISFTESLNMFDLLKRLDFIDSEALHIGGREFLKERFEFTK